MNRAASLMELRRRYHAKVREIKGPASAVRLVDELFQSPVLTIKRAAELMERTPAAVRSQIDELMRAGILEEVAGGKRNMVFVAKGILDLVNAVDPAGSDGMSWED